MKTPQLPVSEQEVQIEALSFLEKLKLQKKKILIGLGSFLGVLVLVGAVFGVYKYVQNQIPLEESTPTPLPAEVSTEEGDPTADWQTYTNTEYGYLIKYPSDWKIEELPTEGGGMAFPYIRSVLTSLDQQKSVEANQRIFIEITNPQRITHDPISREAVQAFFSGLTGSSIGDLYFSENEQKAVSFESISDLDKRVEGSYVWVVSSEGNYWFQFYQPGEKTEFFNLILSTFKFLPSAGSGQGEEDCGGMTLTEAKEIALASECVEEGSLTDNSFCNDSTGTWWIDLEVEKPGCAPACVINVSTKQTEINWRCTGLIPD